MAAIELADAWVSIVPSLRGAQREISKQLGGMDFSGAGKSIGSSIAGNVGSSLTRTLGKVVAAATATAGIGVVVAKGLGRLNAIDQATAKMQGLGFAAEDVQKLMDNALDSVRGTAFGLGDAATVAAQFAAAGIKPGEEMTRLLSSVASNAAAAGVQLGDMGSVFAKAATQANGVQNDVISQLADKGIPIYQALADVLGVTAGEVFKLASDGKINFDQFAQAAEAAAGDVANAMGNTAQGSFDNFLASLGRIGAGFLGSAFSSIAPTLQGITQALGPLETIAGNVGERIGSVVAPAAERLVDVLSGEVKIGWLTELSNAVGALFASFREGDITSDGLVGVFESIGSSAHRILEAFTPLAPQLAEVWSNLSPLSVLFKALAPILPRLADAVASLAESALPGMVTILVAASGAVGALLTALVPVVDVIANGITWVSQFSDGIVALGVAVGVGALAVKGWTLATTAWNTVMGIARGISMAYTAATYGQVGATYAGATAQRVLNAAMAANPIGLIVTAIAALVAGLVYFFTQTELGQEIWANFTQFLGEAWENISTIAEAVWGNLVDFFTGVWDGIVAGFTAAWDAVSGVFEAVADVLRPVFEFIGGFISGYLEVWKGIFLIFAAVAVTVWQAISDAVTVAWEWIVGFISPIIQAIYNTIVTVFTALSEFWAGVWNGIVSVFTNLWNGLVEFFTPIIDMIRFLITVAVTKVQSVWENVWGSISSFFTGIWEGLVGAVSGPIEQITGFITGIYDTVMGALGSVGEWLVNAGSDLIRGFWEGISNMGQWLMDQIGGFFDGAVGWAKDVLGIASPSKVFMQIGEYTGEGMAIGLNKSESDVLSAMDSMLTIPDAADVQARSISSYRLPTPGEGAVGDSGIVQNNYFDHEDPQVAAQMAEQRLVSAARRSR